MIAVDTLVHNFLHRTGILHRFKASHAYGPACYRPRGCAEIIETVAQRIDAREFNPRFPQSFPRFVQLAIWQYCAQQGATSATAIASMIENAAEIQTVRCTVFVIEKYCIALVIIPNIRCVYSIDRY